MHVAHSLGSGAAMGTVCGISDACVGLHGFSTVHHGVSAVHGLGIAYSVGAACSFGSTCAGLGCTCAILHSFGSTCAGLGAAHFDFWCSAQLQQHCGTFTFGVVYEVESAVAGLSAAQHNLGIAQGFSDTGSSLGAVQGSGDARHSLGTVRSFGNTATGFGSAQVSINNARNLEAGCGHSMAYSGRLSLARSIGTAGSLGSSCRVTTAMIPSLGDAASFCSSTADGFGRAHTVTAWAAAQG